MRQLPEQCESCKKEIATLETCLLPDGKLKRGGDVTFRESAEGGIRCLVCAGWKYRDAGWRTPEELRAILERGIEGGFVLDDSHEQEVLKIYYGLDGED